MPLLHKIIIAICSILLILLLAIISTHFYFIYKNTPEPGTVEVQKTDKQKLTIIKKEPVSVSVTMAGDMMFGRLVGFRHQANNFQDLLADFDSNIFANSDIAWANLEGPISDQNVKQDLSKENLERLNFLFSKETIEALKKLKLSVVGLANNHTFNYGSQGLETTQNLLEQNNIAWHGHPTEVATSSVYRYTKDNFDISMIAVHTLYANSASGIDDLIKLEKTKSDFVIVLPHWGDEYGIYHSNNQKQYAETWTESGADLIVGAHPHVVQDAEIIQSSNGNRALVFYSLGNFIFDQNFSEETQLGLILSANIREDKNLNIKLIPIESINLKPQYADSVKSQKIIERICEGIKNYCDIERGVVGLSLLQ